MPCHFPIHAFKEKQRDQKINIVFKRSDSWKGERIDIPCGQCLACRLERARQWAVRCTHEASLYEENSFITLTYDDKNLPKNGSLEICHFQKFMKRLRRQNEGKKIRYFHAGEYGSETRRPHYHALLFNHTFEDKKLFSCRDDIKVYTSETLSGLWPYGFSTIGDVTYDSAGYVARYNLKKITGKNSKEFYGEKKPEYCTMSRRDGIGKGWYAKYKSDCYPNDRIFVNGAYCKPPKYYDGLLSKEDPSTMALLKIKREEEANKKTCNDVINGKTIVESDSTDRRLIVKNEVKEAQVKMLKRMV